MTARRARRARRQEIPSDYLDWFEDRGRVPNHVRYFMDAHELREFWETCRGMMSPAATAEFRQIAAGAGLNLDVRA